jgi:hypothetical protein
LYRYFTVRAFWRVVHAMTEEQKKALLFFTTARGLQQKQVESSRSSSPSCKMPFLPTKKGCQTIERSAEKM